jgi:hypothetical protein
MQDIREKSANLLAKLGIVGNYEIVSLSGGKNNQAFRVQSPSRTLLLKSYFRHPEDPRNRLKAEFSFSKFAWGHGIREIPQPLDCDYEHDLGLYEFVSGRSLAYEEITSWAVDTALRFYQAINLHKKDPTALDLPIASEACFSIEDHVATVDRRVTALDRITVNTAIDQAASSFVQNQLEPTWIKLKETVLQVADDLNLIDPITFEDRCLSPSDFGFHNAILQEDGNLRFIDFEYAGWDDPAKLVCDFFCQPAFPVSLAHFDTFAHSISTTLNNPTLHYKRFALLLPVYQIKWCCIMLNHFLPAGQARRQYAGSTMDLDAQKLKQMDKVRAALANLPSQYHHTS